MKQQPQAFTCKQMAETIYNALKSELIAKVYLENGLIKVRSLGNETFILSIKKE